MDNLLLYAAIEYAEDDDAGDRQGAFPACW